MTRTIMKSRSSILFHVRRNDLHLKVSQPHAFMRQNRCRTRFLLNDHAHELSTSADSYSSGSNSSKNISKLTLKQLIRPFLMKFHPDLQGIGIEKSTAIAREVNLEALQTLNGMIDTIDQIYNRAADPLKFTLKGRIDLQKKYVIEFLVPTDNPKAGAKKPKDVPMSSRRSVELIFSEREINSVQMIDSNGKYSIIAATALRVKAMREISKLLRVAGLQIPRDLESQINEISSMNANLDDMSYRENLLYDELNLQGNHLNRNFGHSARPKSQYEQSREKFMQATDWKKYNKMYDAALTDMEKDVATEGLISMNEERVQRFVAEVISRVRVDEKSLDEPSLDVLQQLIAIRRLSLLLNDNFVELEMEDMGRLWESLFIVLVPERKKKEGKTGLPNSRLRRMKKGKESGYKFSYNADDSITAYIPIDFLDDELIAEFKSHLNDFYSLCLSKGGIDDYFPSYYCEFRGQANMDDD